MTFEERLAQMGSPAHAGIDLYDIEYATAHHEAVTARAKAAITLLIDGPTPRNGQLARAVKTILDDEAGRLEAATDRLEEAVARHYADPTHREVSEANRQRVRELAELNERYERHMRTCFAQSRKSLHDFTPKSVWLTMMLMPVINTQAVQQLNAEVIFRDEDDPTRQGYLDAMLEVADLIPEMRKGLMAQEPAGASRRRQEWEQAIAALDATDAITRQHQQGDRKP